MPTPAKLVAAVLLAALGWLVADLVVRTALPEGMRVGRFREMLALGGLFVGWRIPGRAATGRTGRGTTNSRALAAGLGAVVVLSVLALLLHAFWQMIGKSLGLRYGEIGEAAAAWMSFLWKDVQLVGTPLILAATFGGGAAVGLVAGLVGRRWR